LWGSASAVRLAIRAIWIRACRSSSAGRFAVQVDSGGTCRQVPPICRLCVYFFSRHLIRCRLSPRCLGITSSQTSARTSPSAPAPQAARDLTGAEQCPVVIADKLSALLRVPVDPGESYFFRRNANEVRASLSECGAVKRQNEQHDRRNPKGHESAPS